MPRSRSGSPRGKRRERSRSGERHKERRDKERDGGRERGREKDAHESRHAEKKKDKIKSICGDTNDDNPFGDSELTKKFVWKKMMNLSLQPQHRPRHEPAHRLRLFPVQLPLEHHAKMWYASARMSVKWLR